MKPCPSCGVCGSLSVSQKFVAKPPSEYSLAGYQPKVSAEMKYELSCEMCDFSILGQLEDGYFVAEV